METKNLMQKDSRMKKTLLLCTILIVALVDILIYWNQHVYYRAAALQDDIKKIRLLKNAVAVYPFNDLVNYELGKAYFELGRSDLSQPDSSEYINQAVEELIKSIAINPFSQFSHFYLAQAGVYLDLLSGESKVDYYSEFKKASELVAYNSQMYFEVATLLLSRWTQLDVKEKDFAAKMVED